jgi:threonine aldolase
MARTPDQRRQLRRSCDLIVPDFAERTPAQEFRDMASWCEQNGVEHDLYGAGATIEAFEAKIAALLGKEAAVFMPSGIMAQSAALKVWTETAGLPRFGMHPTAHLAEHEEEAYASLLQCHGVMLGHRLRPLTAEDLTASPQPMACVMVELPIREAGGQLPTWEALENLKAAAQQRSLPLHMDGARLWECVAYYGKTCAEIATGFDSVYVSVYKGVGALSGAVLAGSKEFIAQARLWRRRMGGTLFHLSPMVVSAAMRFDERMALMPALYRRTLELAAGLAGQAAFRVNPAVPQTNMFHLYVAGPMDAVADVRDRIAEEERCWLFGSVRAAEVPGWSATEIYIGDNFLHADTGRALQLFSRFGELVLAK